MRIVWMSCRDRTHDNFCQLPRIMQVQISIQLALRLWEIKGKEAYTSSQWWKGDFTFAKEDLILGLRFTLRNQSLHPRCCLLCSQQKEKLHPRNRKTLHRHGGVIRWLFTDTFWRVNSLASPVSSSDDRNKPSCRREKTCYTGITHSRNIILLKLQSSSDDEECSRAVSRACIDRKPTCTGAFVEALDPGESL